MSAWLRRLRHLLRASREDADLRDEIEAHRLFRQDQMERTGMSAADAAAASRRALGNIALAREDVRDVWVVRWLDQLRQDVRVGIRMLFKHRGLAATAILSLALGIGANSAVFSLVNKTVLEPLPYADPDRLVMIWAVSPDGSRDSVRTTAPEYLAWKRHATLFEVMGTEGQESRDLSADESGAPAERVAVQKLQSDLFAVLGVQPAFGRSFRPDEEQVGAPASVVLLSDSLWARRYGRDPNVLNTTIRLNGIPTTVIGVMPAKFAYLSNGKIDLFAPFTFNAIQVRGSGRGFAIAARLRLGVTMAQAQAEMDAIVKQVEPALPPPSKGWRARVEPLHQALYGGLASDLLLLQGIVGFVLLIACANVAGLLLARSSARRTEMAVRAAIGAGRARIVGQLLVETGLLAAWGGVAGLGVAWVLVKIVVSSGPDWLPRLQDLAIDWHVLLFTVGASLVTGFLFGTLPALQTSRPDLVESLKTSSKGAIEGAVQQRLRSGLVVVQIALAFILLAGSGLLMNSFVRLRSNDLGGDAHGVLTFATMFQSPRYSRQISLYKGYPLVEYSPLAGLTLDRMLERLRFIPGVLSAASSSSLPFADGRPIWPFIVEGRSAPASEDQRQAQSAGYQLVSPGFFPTLRVPMTRGRDFDDRDTATSPWTVVINEAMAKAFWPNENPVGQRLTVDIVQDEQPREVIGIVRNFRRSQYERDVQPAMFALQRQQPPHTIGPVGAEMRNRTVFVVRTAGAEPVVTAAIRRMMTDLDRDRPITDVRPLVEDIAKSRANDRIILTAVGFFAGMATVLAAIGIYGVMSHSVGQRTREIGVRMALGAGRADVLRLIMRRVAVLVTVGLIAGIAGALALTRLIARMLWGVTPTDLVTFIGVSLVMALVGLFAGWMPTRRALEVAPTVALRAE